MAISVSTYFDLYNVLISEARARLATGDAESARRLGLAADAVGQSAGRDSRKRLIVVDEDLTLPEPPHRVEALARLKEVAATEAQGRRDLFGWLDRALKAERES